MKKKVIISNNPEKTFQIAKDLATVIKPPVVIGLSGELGAGKTVFAKGFAEGLKVKELITSPTFLGISESYTGVVPYIHMDFYKKVIYRDKIDFYLKKNSVVLIEWFENYEKVFNEKLALDVCVYIQYLKDNDGNILDNTRQIAIY